MLSSLPPTVLNAQPPLFLSRLWFSSLPPQQQTAHPFSAEAIPDWDSEWNYNASGDILARDQFITWILTGLHKATFKMINYKKKKFQGFIEEKCENPSHVLDHFKMPSYNITVWVLRPHMGNYSLWLTFSPNFPDIKAKFKSPERGIPESTCRSCSTGLHGVSWERWKSLKTKVLDGSHGTVTSLWNPENLHIPVSNVIRRVTRPWACLKPHKSSGVVYVSNAQGTIKKRIGMLTVSVSLLAWALQIQMVRQPTF